MIQLLISSDGLYPEILETDLSKLPISTIKFNMIHLNAADEFIITFVY